MRHPRIVVAGLTLSAAAFISIANSEWFTDEAVIPTQGDVPTIGFGSTQYEDGRKVKLGDRITPTRALVIAAAHIRSDEDRFRASLPGVSLTQAEYDVYLDWLYQFGSGAWQNSSMRRHLLAGDYRQACDALLSYKFSAGYDCSTMIGGKPNKRCWGVWQRQLDRHSKCVAAL